MADFEFRVEGLAALNAALSELGTNGARRAGKKALRQASNVVLRATRAAAPVQLISARMNKRHPPGTLARKGFAVHDHGFKNDSLFFSVDLKKIAFYGKFLEYGTSHAPAYPFMRSAAESSSREAVDTLAAVLGEQIELEARKAAK